MNRRGAEKLLDNKVTLGVDASVAAGPVGRAGTAGPMPRCVRRSSRIHGRAASSAASICRAARCSRDKDANTDAYNTQDAKSVVFADKAKPPAAAAGFLRTLGMTTRATTGATPAAKTDKY
jgi:lipid-binding SYLF domain-containing protein